MLGPGLQAYVPDESAEASGQVLCRLDLPCKFQVVAHIHEVNYGCKNNPHQMGGNPGNFVLRPGREHEIRRVLCAV